MPVNESVAQLGLDEYKYGFRDEVDYVYKSRKGLDEEIVRQISAKKDEPEWMLKNRLKALKHAQQRPWPKWGGDLSGLNFDDIYFYIRPSDGVGRTWDDVPETIKNTFDRLGIPGATYCQPQIASVGYTEKAAKEAGYELKVGKFPFTASGKATALGHTEGFIKIIYDAKYGELLGCHIIGRDATELIAEVVTAARAASPKTVKRNTRSSRPCIHTRPSRKA